MNESMLYLHMQTFRCASLALYKYLEKDKINSYMRLAAKNNHRRKNGGKENNRNTKTDDAGLDDVRWIWEVDRSGQTVRGATTSCV